MNRTEILQKAIATYGEQSQVDMAIEEMSELTKALLKYRRADNVNRKGANGYALEANILEEIADVQIMIDQMRLIFGDTEEPEEYKLQRLNDRLKSCLKFYEFKSGPYPYYALICSQTPKTATETYEVEICTLDKEEKELSPVELTKEQIRQKINECPNIEYSEEFVNKIKEGIVLLDSDLE